MKRVLITALVMLGAWCVQADPLRVGVMVNGTDVAVGSGEGWSFENGILALTNAQTYVLSGTNTAGDVRVEVSASAVVTLDNLKLAYGASSAELLRFTAADADLVLVGANEVQSADKAAVWVASGAKLTVRGDGTLSGDGSEGRGRGLDVYGTVDWQGGTLTRYNVFLQGGSSMDSEPHCGGGVLVRASGVFNQLGGTFVANKAYNGGAFHVYGTLNVSGGTNTQNIANFGAGMYLNKGTLRVTGGAFLNNIPHQSPTGQGVLLTSITGNADILGGIFSGHGYFPIYQWDTADVKGHVTISGCVGSDLVRFSPASGKSVTAIMGGTSLYAIGTDIESTSSGLTAGTYTFDPTQAEYAAAGVALAKGRQLATLETDPVTYQIVSIPSLGVAVNGTDAAFGPGDGWSFADGVLALTNAQPYVLSGTNVQSEVRVVVKADATVTLDNLLLQNSKDTPILNDCHAVTFLLRGTNEITSIVKNKAAIACLVGRTTFACAAGETDASAKLVAVGGENAAGIGTGKWEWAGPIVFDGGTIEARGGMYGAGIGSGFGCADTPSVTINGGIVRATGGGCAAGIGEGSYSYFGAVAVNGGLVEVTGGASAYSDIGVGDHAGILNSHACAISISGGTVVANALGDRYGGGDYTPKVAITGGSFVGAAFPTSVAPTNAAGRAVWKVTVNGNWTDGHAPNILLASTTAYNAAGILAQGGRVCLWLPDGEHYFKVDGVAYYAKVAGADVTATVWEDGVRINGERMVAFHGTGWTVDVASATLQLNGNVTSRFDLVGQAIANINVRATAGNFALRSDAMIALEPTSEMDLLVLALPDATRIWRDQTIDVTDDGALSLGIGTWYLNPAGRYDETELLCTDVSEGVWRLEARYVTVNPQTVARTTCEVFTNGVAVVGGLAGYKVERGVTVQVVYTTENGCVFQDGSTTATATFTAEADGQQVPADQLPGDAIEAVAFVAQTSSEKVYVSSFAEAMSFATNEALVTLLKDCSDTAPGRIYSAASFDLDGAGHTLTIHPFGAMTAFAVTSNRVVRMANLAIDAQNATGMLAVVSSGSLTLTNCCVTVFRTTGRSVLASRNGSVVVRDTVFTGNDVGSGALLTLVSTTNASAMSGCALDGIVLTNNVCGVAMRSVNATDEPMRHEFRGATIRDNGGAPALATFDGVSVLSPDFVSDVSIALGRRSALAFTDTPDAVELYVQNAVNREGDILVTNLCDVAVDAAKVKLLNTGFTPWGTDGNVYLLSDTNFLYATQAQGAGEQWMAYRTFDEAFASQPKPSTSTLISLVHYRHVPNAIEVVTQGDDLFIGAGTNLALRSVLRENVDGTNTTWNGKTEERVSLTGTLTVSGKLTLENVAVSGKIVLSGGVLDVGKDYATNAAPVRVELAATPGSDEVPAIVSSYYTGEQLLPLFSLKGDDIVFVVRDHGLTVVKVGDKVARTGSTEYDTFSAAVAAADDGLVSIVATSNATTGVHRDEVKFGEVRVADGKAVLVKSIRATLSSASGAVTVDEYPAVPVTLVLDGSRVALGEGAVMAFTNVAMSGTLELAGSGLLDLRHFTGTLQVRPTRTGLIATNVADAAQVRLGSGAGGLLYAKGTGVWWRDGSFSAAFVQTGNGVGRIEIDDYGVKTTVNVSGPVTSGSFSYHYVGPADQTGTDTNLAFGVVWCVASSSMSEDAHVVLPPANLYPAGGYPQYMISSGAYTAFAKNGTFSTDLPSGARDDTTYLTPVTLYIRNYAANKVEIASFNMVAEEEDARTAITQTSTTSRDVMATVEQVANMLATSAEVILTICADCAGCYVKYNIVSWTDAVKGIISTILRCGCDAFYGSGSSNSDYYISSEIGDAYARCIQDGEKLNIIRSCYFPAYELKALNGHNKLEINVAGCMQSDLAALVGCIAGSIPSEGPFVEMLVGTIASLVATELESEICSIINENNPHGMVSDSDKPMITVPKGFELTISGMNEGKVSSSYFKSPVFEVYGKVTLDGDNTLCGFKPKYATSTRGAVHVKSGGQLVLRGKVKADATDLQNVYVDDGGLVVVQSGGKESRIGISGQTGNGAIFSNTTLGGWSATANDYAKIFSNDAKPADCTLAVNATNGDVYWYIPPSVYYLDLTQIKHYATYDAAAADCAIAYVLRPNDAVMGVIGADAYDALFSVSVVNDGTPSTPYTLQVDLEPVVSNAVQTAIDAAMPSLVATVTNDVPTATVSTQAGLYYGIPGATEVGGVGTASPSVWTLGTGSPVQSVPGAKPAAATDKAFYQLRALILP